MEFINKNEEDLKFLEKYWVIYKEKLFSDSLNESLISIKNEILRINKNGGRLFFFGNGASASLSSHAALDFSKQANIESLAMNDHNIITALSNDYGYSSWVEKSIQYYAKSNDLIFFISVSGESENLINGMNYAKKIGMKTVSFTGCDTNNYLKSNSDKSLWVDCYAYNIVESIHTIYITALIDLIIGEAVYSVKK